jgi:hypothetical protein
VTGRLNNCSALNQTLFVPSDKAFDPYLSSICIEDVDGFLSNTEFLAAFLDANTIPYQNLNTAKWPLGVPIQTVS